MIQENITTETAKPLHISEQLTYEATKFLNDTMASIKMKQLVAAQPVQDLIIQPAPFNFLATPAKQEEPNIEEKESTRKRIKINRSVLGDLAQTSTSGSISQPRPTISNTSTTQSTKEQPKVTALNSLEKKVVKKPKKSSNKTASPTGKRTYEQIMKTEDTSQSPKKIKLNDGCAEPKTLEEELAELDIDLVF